MRETDKKHCCLTLCV
jgi:hypothetical protein